MRAVTRTAKAIRAALTGSGRVYVRKVFTSVPIRVTNARERKGNLQVRTPQGWHTVLIGDELWSTDC